MQVLFGATNSVENLGSELCKVVLESNEISLHVLKVILMLLEVYVLLLCNFFAKSYLAESIRELRNKASVLVILLCQVYFTSFCLLLVNQIDIFLQLDIS